MDKERKYNTGTEVNIMIFQGQMAGMCSRVELEGISLSGNESKTIQSGFLGTKASFHRREKETRFDKINKVGMEKRGFFSSCLS